MPMDDIKFKDHIRFDKVVLTSTSISIKGTTVSLRDIISATWREEETILRSDKCQTGRVLGYGLMGLGILYLMVKGSWWGLAVCLIGVLIMGLTEDKIHKSITCVYLDIQSSTHRTTLPPLRYSWNVDSYAEEQENKSKLDKLKEQLQEIIGRN